eukprot:gene2249-2689_t
MRAMWEKYYQEANAVVYVLDSADIPRLEEAKLAYDDVCDHDQLNCVPIFTFANKRDLEGALAAGDLAVSFYRPQTSGFSSESESSDEHTNIFSISAYT